MSLSFIISTGWNLLFLVFYGYIFIFLPGLFLASSLKISRLEKISISLVAGLSLYALVVYLVRFANLPFYLAEFFLFPLAWRAKSSSAKLFSFSVNHTTTLFFLLALPTAIIHAAVLVRSAIPTTQGLSFVDLSFHDSMQHLSIIKRLFATNIVPHPGFSGAQLNNYHYLIDLVLASLTRFSISSLFRVYYQLYPIFISLIFQLATFVFARRLTWIKFLPHLTVLFVIFSGNLSYYAQFIRGPEFSWGANAFIINPIIDLLQNPASIFALAQTLTVAHLLHLTPTHLSRFQALVLAIIAGTMIGFKAWGGLLIAAGLLAVAASRLVFQRDLRFFQLALLSLVISAIIFLPHYNPQTSASPVWAPGWTLKRLVNDSDRWNNLEDIFLLEHYQLKHNLPRLATLYFKWFLIYLIGNYGLRLFGLAVVFSWLVRPHRSSPTQILIATISVFSLFLPLFFNQGAMAYDIEQFSPYALMFASIFTLSSFFFLLKHLKLNPSFLYPLSIFLIIVSFPSNLSSLKARLTGTTHLITQDELAAYQQVTRQTTSQSIILLSPSHRNISTLEFAAFTGRNTYYSGRTLSIISGTDYSNRQKKLEDTFRFPSPTKLDHLIHSAHLTHIFLYQEDFTNFAEFAPPGKIIFRNSAAALYQL